MLRAYIPGVAQSPCSMPSCVIAGWQVAGHHGRCWTRAGALLGPATLLVLLLGTPEGALGTAHHRTRPRSLQAQPMTPARPTHGQQHVGGTQARVSAVLHAAGEALPFAVLRECCCKQPAGWRYSRWFHLSVPQGGAQVWASGAQWIQGRCRKKDNDATDGRGGESRALAASRERATRPGLGLDGGWRCRRA
jgi:hypothetical protein